MGMVDAEAVCYNNKKGGKGDVFVQELTKAQKRAKFRKTFKKQRSLHLVMLMALIFVFIFCYIPMVGLLISFRQYKLSTGFAGFITCKWVGLKWFKEFFASPMSKVVIRNTLVLSLLKLLISFPLPIIFALMLNELRHLRFKKFVQTASYLPYFMSWVIVTGLCYNFFSENYGLVNEVLMKLGWISKPLRILTEGKSYWGLAVGTEIWKGPGWSSIIYIAAITGVDETLYEAAQIDGASRMQRIWYITLPAIKSTVIMMLILTLGGLISGNTQQALLLGNDLNAAYSEIIDSYVLRMGLTKFRFDYATAIGLMQSIINAALVFSANALSRKFAGASLY